MLGGKEGRESTDRPRFQKKGGKNTLEGGIRAWKQQVLWGAGEPVPP